MATRTRDYYEVLGIPRAASQKEINEANEVLSDPEKRKKYDQLGPDREQYEAWQRAGRPQDGPFGKGGRVEYRTVSREDMEDLFQSPLPGIPDGARVAGQGTPGRGGGQPGDLFIRVHVRPHPVFRREGDDLFVRVEVSLEVALLGGEVIVPTLKGTPVSLRVPPEVQNGTRLRLRGLGMPRLRGEGHGDLYAEVDVRLPVPLTPEVRELAERLREKGARDGN